jgi:uncharacterized protein YlzI (FlbEa/FlbD family)
MPNADDNTAKDARDVPDREKLQGKAFQVNENSVEQGERIRPAPAEPAAGSKRDQAKLDGKAFQVNENSVEEGDGLRPDDPR